MSQTQRVLWDPSQWIRRRNTTLISECQDCHTLFYEAEHLRVQEFVQKIENHTHRAALQIDLQQSNVYNPFSENSKEMISELGNVELFELYEKKQKLQSSQIVYCTRGQYLIYSESRRTFNRLRLDAIFIPDYVIKQGRSHSKLRDKVTAQSWCSTRQNRSTNKESTTWYGKRGRDAVTKSTSKENSLQVFTIDFSEIQTQLAIGWSKQECKEWDVLAKEDHTIQTHSRGKEKF